jgi:hypothetical protein
VEPEDDWKVREMERKEGRGEEARIILDPRRSSVYKETRAGRDRKFQVSKEAHTARAIRTRVSPYISCVLRITPRVLSLSLSLSLSQSQ